MLEICVDRVSSVIAAAEGGADRVELCANLAEGGTTPSAGMIRRVRAAFSGGLMVIIRPRGHDFLYSAEEMAVMLDDIQVARDLGADGVVIGCLEPDGRIDRRRCEQFIEAAASLEMTFHRAFDMTRNLAEALEDLVALGIGRVLSSGGKADVPTGAEVLAALVRQADGRISIMPGGGVTESNLSDIVRKTGVSEIHLSARHEVRGGMKFFNHGCAMGAFTAPDEYGWREASVDKIRLAKKTLTEALAAREA